MWVGWSRREGVYTNLTKGDKLWRSNQQRKMIWGLLGVLNYEMVNARGKLIECKGYFSRLSLCSFKSVPSPVIALPGDEELLFFSFMGKETTLQMEMYTLLLSRNGEDKMSLQCLLFLNGCQFKIILTPKWHSWGKHILIPFTHCKNNQDGAMSEGSSRLIH